MVFRRFKRRYSKWKVWKRYYVSLNWLEQILVLFGLKYKLYFDTFKIHEEE